MDLAYLTRRAARQHPGAPAVGDRSVTIALAELVAEAERFANALDEHGVPPGAAVGVLAENRIEYARVDIGLALGRRVRVALNNRLHREDFLFALRDCGARAIVHSRRHAEDAAAIAAELGLLRIDLDGPESGGLGYRQLIEAAAPQVVERAGGEEDPAWISYTSGTTGRPKGVVLSHRAVREVAFNLLLELGPLEPGRRTVLTQPLSHGSGYFLLPLLWSGGGVYIVEGGFDPEEVVWAAGREGVSTLKAAPAMFPPLFEALDGTGRLGYETVIYGAAPIPGPVLDEALARFGPTLVQIYGQTEAPMTLTCLHKEDHLGEGRRRSSAGRPWRSVAVEIRDAEGRPLPRGETGEVTIRGRHHMSGYHNLAEATAEVLRDGWVWTKDVGTADEEGYVYLLGRKDEIINSGGFNIAPREVEQVLQSHPAVEECAVMGLPDERWGEAVHAVVQLRPEVELSAEQLLAFARPRLAFRTPKRIQFSPEIPRTPYGKVDRERVAAALGGAAEGEDG